MNDRPTFPLIWHLKQAQNHKESRLLNLHIAKEDIYSLVVQVLTKSNLTCTYLMGLSCVGVQYCCKFLPMLMSEYVFLPDVIARFVVRFAVRFAGQALFCIRERTSADVGTK